MELEEVKLGDLVTFQRGFDISRKEHVKGDIPIISSGGVFSYHNEFKAKAPGVVIGRKGTLGTVHYTDKDYFPYSTVLWIKDFKGNNPKFIYYLLKTLSLEKFDAGAANPTLNRNHIHPLKIKVPKIQYRDLIASILSNYDNLIENNNRRIAILEEMAEEIYKEWFVRLRFPNWRETEVVDGIPEGWEFKKVEEILQPVKRKKKIPSQEYLQEGKTPIIDQSNKLIAGYTNNADLTQDSPLPIVVFGDHTRRVKFINRPFASGADGTQLLYPKNKDLLPAYFYFAIKNIDLSNYAYARHFKFLKSKEILIPKDNSLKLFNEISIKFLNQIDILKMKNKNLQKTRNLLLPRLISGKLNVEHLLAETQTI